MSANANFSLRHRMYPPPTTASLAGCKRSGVYASAGAGLMTRPMKSPEAEDVRPANEADDFSRLHFVGGMPAKELNEYVQGAHETRFDAFGLDWSRK